MHYYNAAISLFSCKLKRKILLQEMLRKCKHMSLNKFWIYHDYFGLSDAFWFIIIMKKKMRDGFDYKVFLIKGRMYKRTQLSICIGISHWNYSRSNKIENIHPSNYSRIMRPVYCHILNISLINQTFVIPFFKEKRTFKWDSRMENEREKDQECGSL